MKHLGDCAVPSKGQPSVNTQDSFSCWFRVKDAFLALHNADVIRISQDIEKIEQEAINKAENNRRKVEQDPGKALVLN